MYGNRAETVGDSCSTHIETPKPQEASAELQQPKPQTGKVVTITAPAAEKIKEFMAEEDGNPQFLKFTFKVAVVLVYHTEWALKKKLRKMIT